MIDQLPCLVKPLDTLGKCLALFSLIMGFGRIDCLQLYMNACNVVSGVAKHLLCTSKRKETGKVPVCLPGLWRGQILKSIHRMISYDHALT